MSLNGFVELTLMDSNNKQIFATSRILYIDHNFKRTTVYFSLDRNDYVVVEEDYETVKNLLTNNFLSASEIKNNDEKSSSVESSRKDDCDQFSSFPYPFCKGCVHCPIFPGSNYRCMKFDTCEKVKEFNKSTQNWY